MKHVHHELLIALAEDADTKFEYKDYTGKWSMIQKECIFYPEQEYRIHDPYRPFKEAIEAGKIVQAKRRSGEWGTGSFFNWCWELPVDHYRIKPEPIVRTTTNTMYDAPDNTRMLQATVKCTWHDDELVAIEVVK